MSRSSPRSLSSSRRSSRTRPASRRPSKPARTPEPQPDTAQPQRRFEAEVLPGLASFARDELVALPAGEGRATLPGGLGPRADEEHLATLDRLPFLWRGSAEPPTERMRTITSLQRVLTFEVPRPKALLGDQALRRIAKEASEVVQAHGPFRGLRIEAAGRDSPTFLRLRRSLAERLGLDDDPDEGELRLRVRPDPDAEDGAAWQVLIRTTPRPLSARPWRVHNLPGGLNACVAAAVWRWLGVTSGQRVLNLMCGSGTLAIERAELGPVARLVGVDLSPDALEAAAGNALVAGLPVKSDLPVESNLAVGAGAALELRLADATASGLEAAAFDVCVVDPPWGDAIGEVGDLPDLYARLLEEAARVVAPGGRAVIVSHALRAFESALDGASDVWVLDGTIRVFHGGHRPAIYRLSRRG